MSKRVQELPALIIIIIHVSKKDQVPARYVQVQSAAGPDVCQHHTQQGTEWCAAGAQQQPDGPLARQCNVASGEAYTTVQAA